MLGPKSLDQILATFNKTLDDLKKLQEGNNKVVDQNNARISYLKACNNELTVEAQRAANVQAKLSELIA